MYVSYEKIFFRIKKYIFSHQKCMFRIQMVFHIKNIFSYQKLYFSIRQIFMVLNRKKQTGGWLGRSPIGGASVNILAQSLSLPLATSFAVLVPSGLKMLTGAADAAPYGAAAAAIAGSPELRPVRSRTCWCKPFGGGCSTALPAGPSLRCGWRSSCRH